jgi:3-deoxy-D-manno-octulosonic-acid transferase
MRSGFPDSFPLTGILYTLATSLLVPLAPVYLLWRGLRQPDYVRHVPERFGFFPDGLPRHSIWIHAVSLGETRAAAPLVRALRERYPDRSILLSHGTPTGRAAGRELFGEQVGQVYLPYDHPWLVRRFLDRFQPSVGLIMETEVWPNLLNGADRRGLPMMLINARLSERSSRRYRRWERLSQQAFGRFAAVAAQAGEDARRFRDLGARRVEVMGNLKFDAEVPEGAHRLAAQFRTWTGARPVFLAASTRDGEEAQILDVLSAVGVPGLLTVIVPRHPQRFGEVAKLLESRAIRYQRRSESAAVDARTAVWLGDSMGELFAYYLACDVAFVGGSLLPFGGQNLIEPMACGKPVLTGPHTWNFEAVAAEALAAGAARRVHSAGELGQMLAELFKDARLREGMGRAGLASSLRHRGATERLLRLIGEVWEA